MTLLISFSLVIPPICISQRYIGTSGPGAPIHSVRKEGVAVLDLEEGADRCGDVTLGLVANQSHPVFTTPRAIVRVPSVERRLPKLVVEFEGWTRRTLFDENCDSDEQCVAD